MSEFAKAKHDIVKAINLDQGNRELRELYKQVKVQWEDYNAKKLEMEKKMAQGIKTE